MVRGGRPTTGERQRLTRAEELYGTGTEGHAGGVREHTTENRIMTDDPALETESDDDEQNPRYAAIETGGGETMIYDRQNPDAWVESSYTIDIGS